MGDRANIILSEQYDGPKQSVYLYTHWNGYRVEQLAAEGLARAMVGGRLDDAPYAGRMVTDVFLAAHDDPILGAGVSALPCDGDGHTVEIDFTRKTVVVTNGADESAPMSYRDFMEQHAEVTSV